jgi:hypothetical protein
VSEISRTDLVSIKIMPVSGLEAQNHGIWEENRNVTTSELAIPANPYTNWQRGECFAEEK